MHRIIALKISFLNDMNDFNIANETYLQVKG